MRFRHLTLDEQLKQTEKTDLKAVARTQLLHSKEWQEHVAEHHGTGPKPQLITVSTADETPVLQQATQDEKKEQKESPTSLVQTQQHTVNHSQVSSTPRTSYVGGGGQPASRGANDEYFGAGSARLQAISGQCSCGMEITAGWQPTQTTEQRLKTSYATPGERQQEQRQDQAPLYTTSPTAGGFGGEQQPATYSTGPSSFMDQRRAEEQRRRRASAL